MSQKKKKKKIKKKKKKTMLIPSSVFHISVMLTSASDRSQ
jgi:hypothetical protein